MNRPSGIVLEVGGGVYRVRCEDGGEVSASLRGRLKKVPRTGGRVVPGDRVTLSTSDPAEGAGAAIEEVLPRTSELVRGGALGRGERVVAANVDRCLVVLAAANPDFRYDVADRFLALAELSGISPVLVVNKLDLLGEGAETMAVAASLYEGIGYPVLRTSALTGAGCERFAALLCDGVSVLMGPSGVGKSSLLNAIAPEAGQRVGEVGRTGRGKHTTVGARLLPLESGGWVVDTPGFSDAALGEVEPEELACAFPEFVTAAEGCRFSGCTHLHEPGCAVKVGVEEGSIAATRYESYRALAEGLAGD